MKRTGLALALLFLAGGLLADPLFCCTLPGKDGAAFSAPAMDCCDEGDMSGCAPKVERAVDRPLAPAAPVSSVSTVSPALSSPLPVVPPGSSNTPVCARVERPPRLHLLNSQFRI